MQCLRQCVSQRPTIARTGPAWLSTTPSTVKCHGVRGANGDRRQDGNPQASQLCQGSETYEQALEFARVEAFEDARRTFEHLLTQQPSLCKAWVSWAQMEKRCHRSNQSERWHRCREVLQRGLELNPSSSCLIQAWGLMELQRGNWLAAVMLLERSARLDSRCVPVLSWQHVRTAKKTVGSRRTRGSAVRPAASGAGGAAAGGGSGGAASSGGSGTR